MWRDQEFKAMMGVCQFHDYEKGEGTKERHCWGRTIGLGATSLPPPFHTSFKCLCSWELPPVPPTRNNLLLQSLSKHLPAAIHSVIISNNYITSWCLVNTYFVWCCVLDWNPLVFMLFATLFYRFYLLSSTL